MGRIFRLVRWGAVLCFAIGSVLSRSEAAGRPHGIGWLFVSPGGAIGGQETKDSFLHLGAGLERPAFWGMSLCASTGYLAPVTDSGERRDGTGNVVSLSGFGRDGFWEFSLNAARPFFRSEDPPKQVYYATLGYALFVRDGAHHLLIVGAGRDFEMGDHVNLSLELRDNLGRIDASWRHFLEFRIGMGFH